MGRVAIHARPNARADDLQWDPWRRRWAVSCRARPRDGGANRSIVELMAKWLDVPLGQVRWVHVGRSHEKLLEVDGLSDEEVAARLERFKGRRSA